MQLRYIIIVLLLSIGQNALAEIDQFEELYIWKMSEVLKLDAKKESEFSDIIKGLNRDKAKALERINQLSDKMAKVKKADKASKLIKDYQDALKEYQDVNLEEVKKLQKVFNPKELAKYLSYKREVLKKLQERLKGG